MEYKKVDNNDIRMLISICGKSAVIAGDPERLESYSHDETADPRYHHLPEVVVAPHTAEEIKAIMRYADEKRIPVTPRGAGSGLSGGAGSQSCRRLRYRRQGHPQFVGEGYPWPGSAGRVVGQ